MKYFSSKNSAGGKSHLWFQSSILALVCYNKSCLASAKKSENSTNSGKMKRNSCPLRHFSHFEKI